MRHWPLNQMLSRSPCTLKMEEEVVVEEVEEVKETIVEVE